MKFGGTGSSPVLARAKTCGCISFGLVFLKYAKTLVPEF